MFLRNKASQRDLLGWAADDPLPCPGVLPLWPLPDQAQPHPAAMVSECKLLRLPDLPWTNEQSKCFSIHLGQAVLAGWLPTSTRHRTLPSWLDHAMSGLRHSRLPERCLPCIARLPALAGAAQVSSGPFTPNVDGKASLATGRPGYDLASDWTQMSDLLRCREHH